MQNSTDYLFTTPSSTFVSENLLFFDTFSHSGTEKNNFDLVQFPSPVIIDLIKIVPLGQPIEAKIPGSVRLGATNPSNCELELFINDLSKDDAHTMTDLGRFFCSEKVTDFNPPLQVQTDGLLLRGSYRTLTLAIFGQIATYDEKADEDQAILSAASPPAQTPASPAASERGLAYCVARSDEQLVRSTALEGSNSIDGSTTKSSELVKDDSLMDNDNIDDAVIDYTGANTFRDPVSNEEISNSECGPTASSISRDKKNDENDFSNSLDEDSFTKHISKVEEPTRPSKLSPETYDNLDSIQDSSDENSDTWCFDVETYEPKSLKYFLDPSLTLQERNVISQKSKSCHHERYKDSIEKEIRRVKELFEIQDSSDEAKADEWVVLTEDLTNDVANMSLSQTLTNSEMIEFLVKQVLKGLDIGSALKQRQAGFKVRHLRAGIKLATLLFHCDQPIVDGLLHASIPHRLLEIYDKEQMSLPLKLLIFKCLSAVCDTVEGLQHIISHKERMNTKSLSLDRVKDEIFAQISTKNEDTAPKSIAEIPQITESQDGDEGFDNRPISVYQALILILLRKPTTRVTVAIGSLIKKVRLYKDLSDLANLSATNLIDDDEKPTVKFRFRPRGEKLEQSLSIVQNLVKLTKDLAANIVQPSRHLPAGIQFQTKPAPSDAHLPLYRWLKHFSTLDSISSLLSTNLNDTHDSTSLVELEKSVKLQNLCLTFLQLILDSPQGSQLLLSADLIITTVNILSSLKSRQCPKRPSHMRMSDDIDACSSPSLFRKESLLAVRCCDLYLKMGYSFKVFSCIDRLFYFHREIINKSEDSSISEPERILHQLYIVTGHPYGLESLIKHLSCIGNLDCLLRFLDMPEYHKQLEFVKETSIDYALELVGAFFRLNNNVLAIADEYLDTLIELSKAKDKTLSVRIRSLIPWLSPFDPDQAPVVAPYSEENFKCLTRIIRKSIPNNSIPFAQDFDFELPPKLITAVRTLRQVCIPPQVESLIDSIFDPFSHQRMGVADVKSNPFMAFVDSFPHHQNQNQSWNVVSQHAIISGANQPFEDFNVEQLNQLSRLFQPYDEAICGELRYHYGIMQVYEHDGYRRILNTLRELVGNYPNPSFQSAALSGLRGRIVLSYINSATLLLQSMIFHLIDARGSEFQDISIIPVVLETYSLLCFVPKPDVIVPIDAGDKNDGIGGLTIRHKSLTIKSDNFQLAQRTKKLILSILMSYTQMCLSVSESEEKVISKSMWTRMLKEILDFTMATPIFFHHGLDVLTKILPPTLPGSSVMDSTDQEQLFKNINHRKLWSAHLHPLHQQIEQMISSLSVCYESNIRALLSYFCNQLCDLSSNAACMVVKTITDSLIACAARLTRDTNGNLSPEHGNGQQAISSQQPASSNQTMQSEDRLNNSHLLVGTKESAYVAKILLNLLSNLITNQAFESAFTNHLQVIGKKDEKLLANLHNTLNLHDEYKPGDTLDDTSTTGTPAGCLTSVTQLVESIKVMSNAKDGSSPNLEKPTPPESLTKINLVELARKTTADRFSLSSSLKSTYRLKVLLDLKSREVKSASGSGPNSTSQRNFDHNSSYSYSDQSGSSSHTHKLPLPPPPPPPAYSGVASRSRIPRSLPRPDTFRSRPQNTSRPPSIHVDDFVDLYGDNSVISSSSRHIAGVGKPNDYRSSSGRTYSDMGPLPPVPSSHADPPNHRHSYFSPPPSAAGPPYPGRAPHHSKSKYMKLK